MRILLVSTYDSRGGAAVAAYRLFRALRESGHEAMLYVLNMERNEEGIIGRPGITGKIGSLINPRLDLLPRRLHIGSQRALFSSDLFEGNLPEVIRRVKPDIVHLHWFHGGFIGLRSLHRIKVPIVWTLHDSWAITGGCHLPGECARFRVGCGKCPVLGTRYENDLSALNFKRKKNAIKAAERLVRIITPSTWLLHKITQATNGIQSLAADQIFNVTLEPSAPKERSFARSRLGLNHHGPVILFSAMGGLSDPNKGFDLLVEAISAMSPKLRQESLLLVAGDSPAPSGIPIKCLALGRVKDESRLKDVFLVADLLALPSRSENLPTVAIEAIKHGVPVVAFDVGGNSEIVEEGTNGSLVKPFQSTAYSRSIEHWLKLPLEDRKSIAEVASRRFGTQAILEKHMKNYSAMIA